jgi:hypothetical protein
MAHFVELDRVYEVCHAVMYKLHPDELEDFKKLLLTKAKDRNGSAHIESSLALRLLLEYYKREKKCKYLALCQLFEL